MPDPDTVEEMRCEEYLIRNDETHRVSADSLLGLLIDPAQYANPFFHVLAGGLILGACFMATDMVTSPMTPWGMIVFGCGCGLFTIIIRMFGAYPEGVSFSILIMNALVPLINRAFKPKTYAK